MLTHKPSTRSPFGGLVLLLLFWLLDGMFCHAYVGIEKALLCLVLSLLRFILSLLVIVVVNFPPVIVVMGISRLVVWSFVFWVTSSCREGQSKLWLLLSFL